LNDIEIWGRLTRGETRDASRLVADLRALSALDDIRRCVFMGLVEPLAGHDDPEVREAAIALLAGAHGMIGLRRLVAALDDGDARVRSAAVHALRASANTQPNRWTHAVFHPRADVRNAALRLGGPLWTESFGAYLRTDPDPENAALARKCSWPKEALALVIDMFARGVAGAEELSGLVCGTPPGELARFLAAQTPGTIEVILRAAIEYPTARRETCTVLAKAALGRRQVDVRKHLVAALLASRALGPDAVALACLLDLRLLSSPAMSAEVLPVFQWWVWRLRDVIPKFRGKKQMQSLLELPLFRDEAGAPRLSAAAALCGLWPGRPLHTLVRHFGEGAVVDTLCADPEHWDAVCRLPVETPNEALRLLSVISARNRLIWRQLAAISLTHWSADRRDACAAVLDYADDAELGDVLEGFLDRANDMDEKAMGRVVANLGHLLRLRFSVRDPLVTVDRLLTRASPTGNPAVRLLYVLLRGLPEADVVRLVQRLTSAQQWQLIRLTETQMPVLTWPQELALAAVLRDAENQHVRRWAARLLRGVEVGLRTARPTITAVHVLTDAEANQIANCPESDLEKSLASALKAPTRGLCAALFRRPGPDAPSPSVCAALLACGDPLPDIHEAFERFAGTDVTFLSNLNQAAVTLWQGNPGLPPLGHAWLHRWEQHAFALAAWLEAAGIFSRFAEIAASPPGVIREQLWEALGHVALLFRYREPARLKLWAGAGILVYLLPALGGPDSAGVAKIIVGLVEAGHVNDQLPRIRERILEVAADLDRETRYRLSGLARFDGIPEAVRRTGGEKPTPGTVDEVRRSTDPGTLLRICREQNRTLVSEAVLRMIELGPAAGPAFRILAREWPRLPCPVQIAESIALWTDEDAIAIVRELVSDPGFSPEARFRAARGLVERGEARFLEDALVAAVVDDPSAWFRPLDWAILVHYADPTVCALALVQSPHPHAYQSAVEHLLGQTHSAPIAGGLRDFLAAGPARPLYLRRRVARKLLAHGDTFGVPVIADELLDEREKADVDLLGSLPPALRESVMPALTAASLIAGDRLVSGRRIMELTKCMKLSVACVQNVFMQLLEHSAEGTVRGEAAQLAAPSPGRDAKLTALARTFAWGIRRGRDLTGRLFRIHMTAKRQDLGYTFLTESRVFVSPLPILRGDHYAQAVVEGLILHEFGHHLYHTGEEAQQIWTRAQKEGIGPLLNLIADEHLERNLRALDAAHGDRLKRLGAHAFLHSPREVNIQQLLDATLGAAFEVLTSVTLGVAYEPSSVEIGSGTLLHVLGNREGSFARFIRALRVGQGNRWNDPVVEKALAHFGSGFRRLDMSGLYEIAVAIARLFGGSSAVANMFGGHESIPWSELEGQRHGDNISDEEVQREVDRILDPRQLREGARDGKNDRFSLNVNPKEDFDRIEQVERLPYDPARHRPVATSVRRHSMRLRDFLDRLGRALVPRRGRLRGRAFDRTRTRAVVTRRDPRMLVARETETANDVFVGTLIDCSSSMSAFDNIDKAKMFGVLVAEAVRDLPGVEARFFGFTHRTIFDAGDGGRCAVTSMKADGGNNDAAALYHAARVASASPRRTRVLVMISDGLPTECSTAALRALVKNLGRRGYICAQVAVHPLEEICFPNYVLLDNKNLDQSVARFGELIMKLVSRGQA